MVTLLLLVGCAEYAVTGSENDLAEGTSFDDTASFDSAAPEEQLIPGYFALRAELEVNADAAISARSLTVEVVAEDGVELMCSFSPPLSWQELSAPNGEPVYLWGRTAVASMDACATMPDWLALGIGELGPDARARLGAVGLDQAAAALYGAYVQLPGGSVELFGYAGTADGLIGVGEAGTAPVAGVYSLQPLYLLALPAAD
jgi:hypothetical protein